MSRPKVYISGPLTSSGDPEDNVAISIEWQLKMIEDGLSPYNPMLTWHADPDCEVPHEDWMEVDLPWVEASEAVFRIPGESRGAEIECGYANDIGVPVYEAAEYERMVSDLKGRA